MGNILYKKAKSYDSAFSLSSNPSICFHEILIQKNYLKKRAKASILHSSLLILIF